MKELIELYNKKRVELEKRLAVFRSVGERGGRLLFEELCFCLLTPQSKALNADKAVKSLVKSGCLYKGSVEDIKSHLYGVRFPNNKASYLITAREKFIKNNRLVLSKILSSEDTVSLRNELAVSVKGYGMKEASHFLRNIGRGDDIAILDRHILKELLRYKVIENIPSCITRSLYLDIENSMRDFSLRIKIPMDALDLLFWYGHTGYFFK